MLQKFCTPWRPVLQEFFTPWHPVLQKFCTVWRPQQQKFCRQWNPELKKFYMLQGQYCRNSESLLFYSQKRQIVEGPRVPTVSISFLFMLFLFFSDHSWNNNTVHADVFFFFSPLPRPLPPPSTLTANQKWPVEQTIASFLALALQATVRGRINNQILGVKGLTCWTLDWEQDTNIKGLLWNMSN